MRFITTLHKQNNTRVITKYNFDLCKNSDQLVLKLILNNIENAIFCLKSDVIFKKKVKSRTNFPLETFISQDRKTRKKFYAAFLKKNGNFTSKYMCR